MLIFTSPAKTLDFEKAYKADFITQSPFFSQTEELVKILKKCSVEQLEEILEVSPSLAQLNYKRFQDWKKNDTIARPAIFAYIGDIYKQFHLQEYTKDQYKYMQRSLRIISGLYGLVKPFDVIKPYRLEMKVAVKTKKGNNLYDFWGTILTDAVNEEIIRNKHTCIVNLASQEYAKVIDFKTIRVPIVNIEFRQKTKEGIKNYGLLTKRARGMMIDFMIKNKVEDVKDLKKFNVADYIFTEEKDGQMFFVADIS